MVQSLGRRKEMAAPGQAPVSYNYDANSRLVQIVQSSQIVDFTYDALGRRTKLTLPNQVSTDYQYDAASRVTAIIYRNALGPLGDLTYQYDASGNRAAVGGSFARTLLPDPVASASYDAANRQLTFGNKSMTYDGNGNSTLITDPTEVTNYTWDTRNRLAGFTSPARSVSFVYDALDRREVRQINGESSQYLYDGGEIIQELPNGGTAVTYLRSLAINELHARTGNEFYLQDALNSVLGLTDSAGAVSSSYSYDPFGTSSLAGVPSGNSFQYTGQENDGTGLYNYKARYYSPQLGRFISEDPLGLAAGDVNLYSYVFNTPLNLIDPDGLSALGDFFRGVTSYFEGICGTFRYATRFYGLFGEKEQLRAEVEGLFLAEVLHLLVTKPELRQAVYDVGPDLARDYISTHKARVAGRAVTGFTVTRGLTKAGKGLGFGLGLTLNAAALNGNIRLAIERGGHNLEDFARAILGGEAPPPLVGRKHSFCG